MTTQCPHCPPKSADHPTRPKLRSHGSFYRRSDSKRVRRFLCLACLKTFSTATFHPAFRQKKRQFNYRVKIDLCSSVTQRRIAFKHCLNRKTVARKLRYLAERARVRNDDDLNKHAPTDVVEFDDLETHEHSKCKPLSVPLAVEFKSRRILAFDVARMPCNGPLAKKARELYGLRKDERKRARNHVLERIKPHVTPDFVIKSDENFHYPKDIERHFPRATHVRHPGKRGAVTGQGELKKVGFDPLFSLNHTCASLRANISRLVRKTWSTTKKAERLKDHLDIYVSFHNEHLAGSRATRKGTS